MKERLLHFIWQHKLFNIRDLLTEDGNSLQIINFGKLIMMEGQIFLMLQLKLTTLYLLEI